MAFCAICGRDHGSGTPCAAAGAPFRKISRSRRKDIERLARRVDLILGIVAILAVIITIVFTIW